VTTSIMLFVGCFAFLAIGSATCVVIDRLPMRLDEPDEHGDVWGTRPWRDVLRGSSRCPSCGEPVRPYDNVPVASYVVLRGRCRHCGSRIDGYHPWVELGAPAAYAMAVWAIGFEWLLLPVLWFVPVALAVTVIDLRTLIVPTRIVWPATAVAVVLSVVALGLQGDGWGRLPAALVGVGVLAGALFTVWFVVPAGMGFGDVRLAVLLGWLVGFYSGEALWGAVVLAVLCLLGASVLGVVLGVAVLGVRGRGVQMPFGPSLVAAAFVCCLWADRILEPWGFG
jgi:leader peptidase (prepilin peptidase)/N-methyltransferase